MPAILPKKTSTTPLPSQSERSGVITSAKPVPINPVLVEMDDQNTPAPHPKGIESQSDSQPATTDTTSTDRKKKGEGKGKGKAEEKVVELWPVKRVYKTPVGMRASVTSIIEATTAEKDKKALQNWKKRELAEGRDPEQAGSEAREKGTLVHSLREKYVRKGIIDYVSDEIDNLLIPLTYYYDKFQDNLWCEGPTDLLLERQPEANKYYWTDPEDGQRKGSLYHQDLPYAGCPDDIAYINGWLCLNDLKTSKRKYNPQGKPTAPHGGVWAEFAKEKEAGIIGYAHQVVDKYREDNAGWLSFYKCGLQLVAYKKLIKRCLGLDIERLTILVACPPELNDGKSQFITLTDNQEAMFSTEWEDRVKLFLLHADIPSIDLKELLEANQ
jgi:hypothetical protein